MLVVHGQDWALPRTADFMLMTNLHILTRLGCLTSHGLGGEVATQLTSHCDAQLIHVLLALTPYPYRCLAVAPHGPIDQCDVWPIHIFWPVDIQVIYHLGRAGMEPVGLSFQLATSWAQLHILEGENHLRFKCRGFGMVPQPEPLSSVT